MSDSARTDSYGCDKHTSDIYEGCHACTLEEMGQMNATIEGMRQALRQIKRWVALARCGDLTAEGAYKQIEIDADRCLPKQEPSTVKEQL